ncbi:MAG: M48 family metallopeptidase [Helicobacteraceae bacterium]|nr:M48 family metallopeptidase [Helicobacteraceae bacterium]
MFLAYFFCFLYAAHVALDIFLNLAQIRFARKARGEKPTLLSNEDWIKSADYEIARLRFETLHIAISALILIAWFLAGFNLLDRAIAIDNAALKAAIFIASVATISGVLNIPFDYYKTFAIDEKFGFSRLTKKLFWLDTIKGIAALFILFFIVAFAIASAISLTYTIVSVITSFEADYAIALILFAVCMFFIALANLLFPYFAKLFNKFEQIDDTPLGAKIKTLLDEAGFSAKGVFKIDAGKRDSRLNAYFAGVGKTKRVALFDTLIDKLSENEILAVLGHELGHFKHKDILKRMVAIGVMILVLSFLFVSVINPDFCAALNLPNTPHIWLTVFSMLVMQPIAFFFQPFMNALSRRAEFAADSYGANLTNKTDLKNALIKLATENKSFPKKRAIYALWNETHPNILTRIERL